MITCWQTSEIMCTNVLTVLSLCISVDCGKRNVKNVALMKLTLNQLLEEDHLEQLSVILGNL